jgi:predicted dehydrogenase
MKEVSIALVSMGGYAYNFYGIRLLRPPPEQNIRFVGGVSRSPENVKEEYKQAGIPVYPSLEEFYENCWADLIISSGPIHMHAPVTCKALANNSNVLCEKPVSGTIQEALKMSEEEEKSERFVAIGYQWSFSDTIQALKKDIIEGILGDPIRLKTLLLWPRPLSYYNRNNWAGRKKVDQKWVLDSPVQNATAHYLHNMFYILGESREKSVKPVEVESELYRANNIENYDAAALRCVTEGDAEILFYSAHCVPENKGLILSYEFEKAVVEFSSMESNCFTVRFKNGHTRNYGNPGEALDKKLWDSVSSVHTKEKVACGIQASIPHILCVNGAQESIKIQTFPKEMVKRSLYNDSILVWVEGLSKSLQDSYQRSLLPSESDGLSWAQKGCKIDLTNYNFFPSSVNASTA